MERAQISFWIQCIAATGLVAAVFGGGVYSDMERTGVINYPSLKAEQFSPSALALRLRGNIIYNNQNSSTIDRIAPNIFVLNANNPDQQTFRVTIPTSLQYMRDCGCEIGGIQESTDNNAVVRVLNPEVCLPGLK